MRAIWLIGLIWTSLAWAQDGPPASSAIDPAESAGIWPTDKLLENMVRRTAREATARYELSPEQQQKMEAYMLGRWPKFLQDNRSRLQPLLNGYLEAQFSPQPPSQEQVQAWARQALPVFEEVRQQLEAGNEDIRGLLTPTQRSQFEAQATKMRLGLELFNQKMTGWSRGQYREGDFWKPPPGWEPKAKSQEMDRPGASQETPTDQIDIELAAWDRYVENFIETYNLDPGQQQAARSFLIEAKQQARAHRDRHRQDIQQLEQTIQARQQQDRADVEAELTRLYGPIDHLFASLKRRLESLPTEAQRQVTTTQPAK